MADGLADKAPPLAPAELIRQLSPSLLGPALLEQLVADKQQCDCFVETLFMRALPEKTRDRMELFWPEVKVLTVWLCEQVQHAPPPEDRVFMLFEKMARTEAALSLPRFQMFFTALIKQVHQETANYDVAVAEKPLLQPQVTTLMHLLLAIPPYISVPVPAGPGQLQHAALNALATAFAPPDNDEGSADWLNEAIASGDELGWDAWSSSSMAISADSLTAARGSQVSGWAGAIGSIMSEGVQHFSIRVWQPVDDAFFVGVCDPDVSLHMEPKINEKAISWSGGSANRPGTVRLFGEKLRQMATYIDGDVIGIAINFDSGSINFFKNGVFQFHFPSACRGPACPFFAVKHTGPAATLLPWRGTEAAAPAEEVIAAFDEELCSSRSIEVDGSLLEGGGQVLRVALGCSALLRTPVHIHSIRAGRSNPGLGAQHTAGAKLVSDCCNGLLSPDSVNRGTFCTGVTSLKLWPSVRGVRGGTFLADTRSAGAVTLLLQAALPCCLLGEPNSRTQLKLKGGTNVCWSPPVDHTMLALLPLLQLMGVANDAIEIAVHRRGFYPQGGGEVTVTLNAVHSLKPLLLHGRGDAVSVRGLVFVRGVAQPLAKELEQITYALLRSSKVFEHTEIIIELDTIDAIPKEDAEVVCAAAAAEPAPTFDEDCGPLTRKQRRALHLERLALTFGACGVVLVARGSLGGIISADALMTDDFKSAPNLAVKTLEEQWAAGGALDEHLMDQVVLYMAMAAGKSNVLCNGPTGISSLHLETATALTTQITSVPFTLTQCEGAEGSPCVLVECEGLGWQNESRWRGHVHGITFEHGVILRLSCDESWEQHCLQNLSAEGVVHDEHGERCRHVTLLPMRAVRDGARQRCAAMHRELAALPLPPIDFHNMAGTAERPSGCSVFFALRGQRRWRELVQHIAMMIGVDPPPAECLFHMSIWNSQSGNPFRSVGDVRVCDFPYELE